MTAGSDLSCRDRRWLSWRTRREEGVFVSVSACETGGGALEAASVPDPMVSWLNGQISAFFQADPFWLRDVAAFSSFLVLGPEHSP